MFNGNGWRWRLTGFLFPSVHKRLLFGARKIGYTRRTFFFFPLYVLSIIYASKRLISCYCSLHMERESITGL